MEEKRNKKLMIREKEKKKKEREKGKQKQKLKKREEAKWNKYLKNDKRNKQ